MCVCVWKHLVTRCQLFRTRTSNFLSRGAVHAWQSLPNEDTVSAWWYGKETSFPRTCFSSWTVGKAVALPCFCILNSSFRFRFDDLPFHFRYISDSDLTIFRFIYLGIEFHFDELQVGLRRTMLKSPCYVNRGLWDNLALLRTIPDKHVELSSVCVSPPGATSSRLDGPSEKVQVR